MKAILIKYNNKVIAVAQLSDLTTKQFLDLQKSAAQTLLEKDMKVTSLQNHIIDLEENVKQLESKCKNLQRQINVITGIEEESEEQE